MRKLLLVEGLAQYERVSEAELINETFRILMKGYDGRITRHIVTAFRRPITKDKFLELLEKDCNYLHISAHGEKVKGGKGVIYVRNRGAVTAEDIVSLDIKAGIIFVNACEAYTHDLINAFLAAGRPRRRVYIAPKNAVAFDEAYLIALLFWKGLMLDRKTSWRALAHYAYKLPGFKANYWYNDDVKKALADLKKDV